MGRQPLRVAVHDPLQAGHGATQLAQDGTLVQRAAAALRAAAGHQDARAGERQPGRRGVRPESGEQGHGDGAQGRGGEQGHHGRRAHGHHQADPVARSHADAAQARGERQHPMAQARIRERGHAAGLVLGDERGAPRAVAFRVGQHGVQQVEAAALEPAGEGGIALGQSQEVRVRLAPAETQVLDHGRPVALGLLVGEREQFVVAGQAESPRELAQQRAVAPVGGG